MRKEAERTRLCLAITNRMSTDGIKAEDGKNMKDGKGKVEAFAYAVNYEENLKETCNYFFSNMVYSTCISCFSLSNPSVFSMVRSFM